MPGARARGSTGSTRGDWEAASSLRACASRCASPSTAPTSAGCCRSTSPTATRASRPGRSRAAPTRRSRPTSRPTSPPCARSPPAPGPTPRWPTTWSWGRSSSRAALARRRSPTPSRSTAARSSTRSSRTRALPAGRPRGARARARRARRLPPHGGEPVGGDGRPRARRAHAPRPARRRHREFAPRARPRRPPASAACERLAAAGGGDTATACRRSAFAATGRRRRALARVDLERPPRRLRRQADRLQGRRPAARRVAARRSRDVPGRELVVVGFGAFRDGGWSAWPRALAAGDLDAAPRSPAARTRRELRHLRAFLDGLDADEPTARYLARAPPLRERVVLTGRLEHAELADLLAACEALVVPSTFPEAFGMVAAEAAACGALPSSRRHSGAGRGRRTLCRRRAGRGPALAVLRGRRPRGGGDRRAPRGWLEAPEDLRAATREAIVASPRALLVGGRRRP